MLTEKILLSEIHEELASAQEMHEPMNSLHEAYAVILEEVEEFWEQVRMKSGCRDLQQVKRELIQIAAMACRTILDMKL
jgi:glutamyl-tRNA reductase